MSEGGVKEETKPSLFSAMAAGKEIDELIAVKVMGIGRHPDGGWLLPLCADGPLVPYPSCPRYSTDIHAAFQVIEKLAEGTRRTDEAGWWKDGYRILFVTSPSRDEEDEARWFVSIGEETLEESGACSVDEEPKVEVDAPTLPLGICRAALEVITKYGWPDTRLPAAKAS